MSKIKKGGTGLNSTALGVALALREMTTLPALSSAN